jgi:hypothetical protein
MARWKKTKAMGRLKNCRDTLVVTALTSMGKCNVMLGVV